MKTKRREKVITKRQMVKLLKAIYRDPEEAVALKFIEMARTKSPRVVFDAATAWRKDGWQFPEIGITEVGNHSFTKFNRHALSYCRKHGIK